MRPAHTDAPSPVLDRPEGQPDRLSNLTEHALMELYAEHRLRFIRWAMGTFRCEREVASDTYQQAFMILFQKVKKGGIRQLRSTQATYLYGIGKNLLLNYRRAKINQSLRLEEAGEAPNEASAEVVAREAHDHQHRYVQELMEQLSDRSQQVLYLYYYAGYSMEAIAHAMGYKNEQVAKKAKYDALQTLRALSRSRELEAAIW